MSADNGIYIAKFKDGTYRVAHLQCIENTQYPDGENAFYIAMYWKHSRVFHDLIAASSNAIELEDLIENEGYVEYGIQHLHFSKTYEEYVEEAKLPIYDCYRS